MINENERYEDNPFILNMEIKTKNKQRKLKTSETKKYESLLVNAITGETQGTEIVTYQRVDEEEFVKLFTRNIALTFNLTTTGIKALNIVAYAVQKHALGKDIIPLGRNVLKKFSKEFYVNLTEPTFNRGIRELVKNQIIAKSTARGIYFINPNFIFNGNRLTLTNILEKKRKSKNYSNFTNPKRRKFINPTRSIVHNSPLFEKKLFFSE